MSVDWFELLKQAPATVLAFICIVELRALRPVMGNIGLVLAALLERERAKDAADAGANINIPRVPTLKRLKTQPEQE